MKRIQQRGFTLVELIIVIAIGGLITTIAFLAVSQGQRNKRDDARKTDANRYLLAAKLWASEHNGILPAATDDVVGAYITSGGASFKAPDGGAWVINFGAASPPSSVSDVLYVVAPGECSGGFVNDLTGAPKQAGSRQMAVAVYLEDGVNYCVSN